MPLIQVTAPIIEPVTLTEAKAHLRVTTTDDDTLIGNLITRARFDLDGRDGWLGRALCTQTWDLVIDQFPWENCAWRGRAITIPLPPLQSVTSITYVDTDGATQTLASTEYQVVGLGGWGPARVYEAYEKYWPSTRWTREAVTVRFVAGYASGNSPDDASAVPADIKHAMLMMIGHWYENREAVSVGSNMQPYEIPMAVQALLKKHQVQSA